MARDAEFIQHGFEPATNGTRNGFRNFVSPLCAFFEEQRPEKNISTVVWRRNKMRRHFCFQFCVRGLRRNFARENKFVTPLEQ